MNDTPPELWVGAECTINRVGERFRDQAVHTGFRERLDDLDRLAALGARRVRLPVLWEHVQPNIGDALDFTWPDQALARLGSLGLEAIVGLLHHGSGPRGTDLLDERFATRFAAYAREVARRYPQQRWWTPVNEPLTTARFSCLYGVWYPHAADDRSFVRALLNQVQATVLAMRAIREVNPDARLVQTDDLGYTRCTPSLAEQAAFDNERRWLAFDLLAGKVDESHPLWDWLTACGADESELRQLREAPCPPDIVGINAYVTSERFLDERLELHPPHLHGGNGRERYADVETVRAHGQFIDGFGARLREAHARYGLPLAITEVHLGCTREEQMRWLHQAWQAAVQARREGIDVRGVTAWAAFGTVDWNSLLTREAGHYEPGLWDARSSPPRLTGLGQLAAQLAEGGEAAAHPVLASPGWWQRDLRLAVAAHGPLESRPLGGAPLLVLGAGALGRAVARLSHMRGLPCVLLAHADCDVADRIAVARAIERHRPWAVVNAAGYGRIDAAEADARQWNVNADGPAVLAAACRATATRLLTFSCDYVFGEHDGHARAWLEHDVPEPLNAYGRAKLRGEQAALPDALVVRTSALFGPWDDHNFVGRGLALLRDGRDWFAAADQVVSPTYLPDLVQAALDLLVDGESGVWHLTNGEALSWAEFARRAADGAGLDTRNIRPVSGREMGQTARRPACSALGSVRGRLLPTLADALERYPRDHEPQVVAADVPTTLAR